MKLKAIAVALTALIAPLSASAVEPKDLHIFQILVHVTPGDGKAMTLKHPGRQSWGAIAEAEMSMPSEVQLDGDVPDDVRSKIGSSTRYPLAAGAVLPASVGRQTAYCGRLKPGLLLRPSASCLMDTDGDGRFDMALRGQEASNSRPDLLIIDNSDAAEGQNKIYGAILDRPVSLVAPIPYHQVPNPGSERIGGGLLWTSNYGAQGDGPLRIRMAYQTPDYSNRGSQFFSPPVEVAFAGEPVEVDLGAIKVTILGIGPEGELICKLAAGEDEAPMEMAQFWNAIPIWSSN